MSSFKDYIAADNKNVFLNEQEFAEKHKLNGLECVAVVQEVVINDDLTTETATAAKYTDAMYGSGCIINVKKSDLPYVPETGDTFRLDGKYGQVVLCKDDEGILIITWAVNET
ncbi:MAG: hypothetical protein ACLTM5_01090 [Dialister sp.]